MAMAGRLLVFGMLILSGELVWAQAPAARPDPSDPQAAVAPTVHRSVFDGYRNHATVDVGSWQEANDNVGRIGGWREYLKEAHRPASTQPADTPAQSVPKADAPPVPSRHHGH